MLRLLPTCHLAATSTVLDRFTEDFQPHCGTYAWESRVFKALWLETFNTRGAYVWGAEAGVTHMHCNHTAGVCVQAFRQGLYPSIQAHTGTIDAFWNCLKDHMPASLRTRVQQARVNPLLMKYTREWQWRYVNGSRDLLLRTGHAMYRNFFG